MWLTRCNFTPKRMDPGLLEKEPEAEQTRVVGMEYRNHTTQAPFAAQYCSQAQRCLEAFAQAVQELMQLHEQQFLAILEGDGDAGRFDLLAHFANEKKQNAKYAYLQHLETHGCSSNR